MVQVFLRSILRGKPEQLLVFALVLVLAPGAAAKSSKKDPQPVLAPELQLEGGRRLTYERSFRSEREVKLKRSFWNKLVDIVAGEPEFHSLANPYEVVTDSHDRIIVTDPGAAGIHIFDFGQQKYKFISREKEKDGLHSPQCVAVDAADNIYVTDSESGRIFVFRAQRKVPADDRKPERRRGLLQAAHRNRGGFSGTAHLRDRHVAQPDFRSRHAGQRIADHR